MSENEQNQTGGEQSPQEQPPAAPLTRASETVLRVTHPVYCTSFNVPQKDGGTLVIDRKGVAVPTSAAATLIEQAAASGVTLTEQDK